ncbi:VOC family protein [Umezawaea tangerina]|uniref:Putative enzyme related to lactoylglutathione lyase n=1 Tax=Umezawaea tangerina TaxID=84725 RepID=A0A2T0SR23_9PSEU|nr:VOC family protein [Umezawaea tangerina]PRY35857.1 putative enzyme related to lactoylglutathione lyase [Umezawaea tangerina]
MLRGLSTVSYFATDLPAATDWYTRLLGVPPYYVVPDAYVEFRIGDYRHELGIVNSRYARHTPTGGAVVYWAVDDVRTTLTRLVDLGATIHEAPEDRGGAGYVTATVLDPFGNILGIMANPHYHEVLATMTTPAQESAPGHHAADPHPA